MLQLKKATIKDIELINSLARATFYPTYKETLSLEQLDYMFDMMYSFENLENQITKLGHIYFLATKNGENCGYLSVEKLGEGRYMVQKIYILPSFQGLGIGKELLEFAFDYAKNDSQESITTVELHVNRNNKAQIFYEKMGMTIRESGDFDIGNGYFMNDYIMVKELDS